MRPCSLTDFGRAADLGIKAWKTGGVERQIRNEVSPVVQITETEGVPCGRKEVDAVEPLGLWFLLRDGRALEESGRDGAARGAAGAWADLVCVCCAYVGVRIEIRSSGEIAVQKRN